MINEALQCVEDININNAWREAMLLCIKKGYDFVVKGGSYKGQIRKQLSDIKIVIKEPWLRPLAPITPPPYPPPTSEEKIEQYFIDYIMNEKVHGKEDYTYGSYIVPQLQPAIDILLKADGNTNQACISIGDREAITLKDPPCLRVVSFKVVEKKLQMSVFFRSWDLFCGLPENLGGLQYLKEYVLSNIEDKLEVKDGLIIAFSDGLHLYEQYFDLVNAFNMEKIKINKQVLKDKEKFTKKLDLQNDL